MNIASASPFSVWSAQTVGLRSYFIIFPSKDPLTAMAVGTLVDPAEAGKVVVNPVGVAPPAVAIAVVLVAELEVVFVAEVTPAAPGRHREYHSLE